MDIRKLVNEYKTESQYGFIQKELDDLLTQFPDINMKKFNDAMMGNTCMMNDRDEIINYHCDVVTAIRCGVENRDMYQHEFD